MTFIGSEADKANVIADYMKRIRRHELDIQIIKSLMIRHGLVEPKQVDSMHGDEAFVSVVSNKN